MFRDTKKAKGIEVAAFDQNVVDISGRCSEPVGTGKVSDGYHLSRRAGQAVVEMTFGFLLFFTMFMAIVEFSHLLYAKVTLQHALRTAGRYMITGRTEKNQQGIDRPRDQVIREVFCANVIAAGVQCPALGSPNFQFACVGGPCTAPGGGPQQTVTVTVRVFKPTLMPFFARFFPNRGVPLNVGTTWKNEPFPTG